MHLQKYLYDLGLKVADQQGFGSPNPVITPFWFSVANMKAVGVGQAQNNYCYEPRLSAWFSSLGTDRGYFLYGKLFMTAIPSVVPTDNYEISLALGNVYSNIQSVLQGNNIVASRGTNKTPYVTKINSTNFFDPLSYQSSYPEMFLKPTFIVSTNGTGTLNYYCYAQFSGYMVSFN